MDLEEKDYGRCCDYCLADVGRSYHCGDRSGVFRGCHETFSGLALLQEHRHHLTGGCRWPGNIEDFYRKDNIWHKKEKPKEEEDTPARSPNSKRTPAVGRRSTSNASGGRISPSDRHPGLSWE